MKVSQSGYRVSVRVCFAAAAATGFMMASTGCHPAGSTEGVNAAGTAPRVAPTTEQSMQAVKNNPNIPEATKANILRQMQGKPVSPSAAPPTPK